MRVVFSNDAFADYAEWQKIDKRIAAKINSLIHDIIRHPYEGIGKPEPLKHQLSGSWSRRIDSSNRLVYHVEADGKSVVITGCRGHYE